MFNLDNKIDKNSKKNIHYDFSVIRSSIITILKAIYLSRKEKSFLMIYEANDVGGV